MIVPTITREPELLIQTQLHDFDFVVNHRITMPMTTIAASIKPASSLVSHTVQG
jgi:hypothetical protein